MWTRYGSQATPPETAGQSFGEHWWEDVGSNLTYGALNYKGRLLILMLASMTRKAKGEDNLGAICAGSPPIRAQEKLPGAEGVLRDDRWS